ncbi:MAG: ABC transporter substrate-binding protein [Candidatus Bipolaricaulota bacterium]
MNRRTRTTGRMGVALVAVALLACASVATTAASDGKVLTVGITAEPDSLNPVFTTNILFESVAHTVVEKLFYYDENFALQPWLATEWGWIDPLTFEISIREGISFSNGEPLDATAVAFSLNLYAVHPAHSYKLPGGVYSTTTVVDDNTVHVHVTRPFSPLLDVLVRAGGVFPPIYYTQVGEVNRPGFSGGSFI